MYLFDTDYLGLFKRKTGVEYERLSQRLAGLPEDDFFVSIVSFHEQVRGWQSYLAKAKDQHGVLRGYDELEKLLIDFTQAQVLPFDEAAADLFDSFRKQKIRVGTMDLRIAVIAISNNLILLTRNTVDFERIPGLTFEDWT